MQGKSVKGPELKRSTDKEANCKEKASHINSENSLPGCHSASCHRIGFQFS